VNEVCDHDAREASFSFDSFDILSYLYVFELVAVLCSSQHLHSGEVVHGLGFERENLLVLKKLARLERRHFLLIVHFFKAIKTKLFIRIIYSNPLYD